MIAKHKNHLQKGQKILQRPIGATTALAFLFTFALLVTIYIVANLRSSAINIPDIFNKPSAAKTVNTLQKKEKLFFIAPFKSEDDFKEYLANCKSNFDSAAAEPQITAKTPETAKIAAPKTKAPVIETILPNLAQKYLNLGEVTDQPDALKIANNKIYYSPEGQYYIPGNSTSEDEYTGQSFVINTLPNETSQAGSVDQDGSLLVIKNSLIVLKNNLITAYDVANPLMTRQAWHMRLNDDTRVVSTKLINGNIYLITSSKINASDPCPIKPVVLGENPYVIKCEDIYHYQSPTKIDNIVTLLQIDYATGKILNNTSFTADSEDAAVLIADKSIYITASLLQDKTAFLARFLQNKCKNIVPDYLIEKAQKLATFDISLASRENEIRSLFGNWISSLSSEEQTRITGEITRRFDSYMQDNYRDLEQTNILKLDTADLAFIAQNEIPGRLASLDALDEYNKNLRLVTVANKSAAKDILKLVYNKTGDNVTSSINNIYILDQTLEKIGNAENLDIQSNICAINFSAGNAYASTCRDTDPTYVLDLSNPQRPSLQGKIAAAGFPSCVYAPAEKTIFQISKDARKIKLALIDTSIPSKPEIKSEYDLNDYWADFESNFAAFSADKLSKTVFIPASRGGYVFTYKNNQLELIGETGNFTVARTFFNEGYLYLIGDRDISIVNKQDLSKISSLELKIE